MVEQSFLIDWKRQDDFWEKWNISFRTVEMNGSNTFELVFVSYCPEDITDCVSGGVLKPEVVQGAVATISVGLNWDKQGIVSIANNVTWNIGNSIVPLKGIFLRSKVTGYVLGYSIAMTSFDVTNQMVIDKDTVLWSFHDGGVE